MTVRVISATPDELLDTLEPSMRELLDERLGQIEDSVRRLEEVAYALKDRFDDKEAARYLNVSLDTLARYREHEGLPYSQPKKKRYYRKEDLNAFMDRGRVEK